MAIEIEHKFLLENEDWRQQIDHSVYYQQGYLSSTKKNSIRVRISDTQGWLNIKSPVIGAKRLEYEYQIPLADAKEIIEKLCHKPIIEKIRHYVFHDNHTWEIDEFEGDNKGLIVAEIELKNMQEKFSLPTWAGQEVTHDLRYYNNCLCKKPFKEWT